MLCLIFTLGVLTLGLMVRTNYVEETAAVPGYGKRVIIDAGHGEPDGGTVGSLGILEKDLNLAVSHFLQGYLEQSGTEVLMTRADDDGIYDAESKTIRQKKRSDLKNRQDMVQKSDADLLVSIHMNHFSDSKYSGPQVFYSTNHSASKVVAETVQSELNSVLNPPEPRVVKPAGKEIYLLKSVNLPAVLVECGFLSNMREEKLLVDEAYQKKVAWAIYCSVVKYFAESR